MAKRTQRTKPAPVSEREVLADEVCKYMHDLHRDLSIDTLLTRPCDALRMGIVIAGRLGKLRNVGRANAIAADIGRYAAITPDDIAAIHHVLRAALSSRKRGDLRTDRY